MEEKFPVLRVEADDVRRQNVDGEIRRELCNVFAGAAGRGGFANACHGFSTRSLRKTLVRWCKALSRTTKNPLSRRLWHISIRGDPLRRGRAPRRRHSSAGSPLSTPAMTIWF